MNTREKLSTLLEAFFTERLVNQMQASPHTIASYRDTFQLLLKYALTKLRKQPSQLVLKDLNARFLSGFLMDLEKKRNISIQSRNVRLSAIRSFFKYLSFQEPERSALISQVLAIPNKRTSKKLIHSLTRHEVESLLAVQDISTWIGRRDHAFILVAIETGLRLSELIHLRWENVHITEKGGYIQCIGKGRKERCSVFSRATSRILRLWGKETEVAPSNYVYPTIYEGTAMSPDCVQKRLKRYKKLAEEQCPSLKNKKVTPHVLRHTAAMNFLHAGVDLSTIAILLGHESVETTQIYLDADLSIKEKTLNKLAPNTSRAKRFKVKDRLIQYLKSL